MAAGKLRWAVRGVLVALLIVASLFLAKVLGFRLTHRIDDRAALLDPQQLPRFEDYLANIKNESGIDIRFLLVIPFPAGRWRTSPSSRHDRSASGGRWIAAASCSPTT
jgi:hypothetical protein